MSSEPQLGVDLVHERVWVGFWAGAGLEVCRKIYSPIRRMLWGSETHQQEEIAEILLW